MKSLPLVIGILVLIVLGLGTYFFVKGSPIVTPSPSPQTAIEQASSSGAVSQSSPSTSSGEVKEFTLVGSNFKFTPNEIKVKKGDRIKITLKSMGIHDLSISGYNVQTKVLSNGESESVEFVADKSGTFEFWCTVGDHKAMGMVGSLIVE